MKIATSLAVALATIGSIAHPMIKKRAITDGDILNYALTLEHLEDKFYREGLANFTQADFAAAGFNESFYKNLLEVSYDETTHVTFLTDALTAAGVIPVQECTYAFGVTDVTTFVLTAAILEGVGVSAYLGAAASIINKDYLTAAGSILTIEARHSAYLRDAQGESPFPQPFSAPLDFNEVYTLAAPMIVSCPAGNPMLPFKAFPSLALDPASGDVKTNSTIILDTEGYFLVEPQGENIPIYAAWISVTGPTFVPATLLGNNKIQTTVPEGFHGQSYLVITSCNDSVSDDTVTAGPALVEVVGSNGSP
ncbi:hypothetical protein K432DRAFT_429248 [Lepidopterella palustris CBS 459.81]|uniref:Uncharacterized protein n=1 Tax=Lepidopterella palustris CBS 459.81 TaxID=1314670 RepID=A0A8E2E1J3_9PEZI|nr:hypothetical protein K432DRAFT_429248 [Lepidopterella palustris CBS 459.81]